MKTRPRPHRLTLTADGESLISSAGASLLVDTARLARHPSVVSTTNPIPAMVTAALSRLSPIAWRLALNAWQC